MDVTPIFTALGETQFRLWVLQKQHDGLKQRVAELEKALATTKDVLEGDSR